MAKIEELFSKAMNNWQSNNFLEAKNIFKKILKLRPGNAEILSYIGVIDLQTKKFEDGIKSLKLAHQINPDDKNIKINLSNGLMNYANELIEKNDFEKAKKLLQESVDILEKNKASLLNLFRLFIQLKDFEKAKQIFLNLKNLDSTNPEIFYLFGNCLLDQSQFHEAISLYDQALRLDPNYFECFFHQALCYDYLNDYENSLKKYNQCLEINSNYELAIMNKAQLHLANNEFEFGWELYDKRWASKKNQAAYFFDSSKELKSKNDFDKNILLWGEQGVGDQILFSSIFHDLSDLSSNLTVTIDERLISLYARSFSAIKFISKEEAISSQEVFDFHLPIGNLGKFFRNDSHDFKNQKKQFLYCDDLLKNKLSLKFKNLDKPLCGVSWSSINQFYGVSKSIPSYDFFKAISELDFNFINFEYTNNSDQPQMLADEFNFNLYDVDEIDKFNDFESVAALISSCDLIITISNVTAHLAGALGVKTILLVPFSHGRLWYWSDIGPSKWYPSVHIIRQKQINNWSDSLKKLRELIN